MQLAWKDVDLFRRVVIIKQEKTGETKNIPLTTEVLGLLKAMSKRRWKLKTELAFPSDNGTAITTSNLIRVFRRACDKGSIKNFRFHDLIHTFATRLAQSVVDIYLIQRLLGHKDPKMVQCYAHHSVESLRRGIDTLQRANEEGRVFKLAQI